MARIVCFANSLKNNGRCIAGVEMETGRWVRPVYHNNPTAGISLSDIELDDELRLLDIIDVPLDHTGPDLGCQPENRILLTGKWKKLGRLSATKALEYIENISPLLHTNTKRINPQVFEQIKRAKWKSIQLVHVQVVDFHLNSFGKPHALFTYHNVSYDLKITDPIVIKKIEKCSFTSTALLTISIGTPFKAPCDDKPYHYKMVAGVIELPKRG